MQFFRKFGKIICWRPAKGLPATSMEILDLPLFLDSTTGPKLLSSAHVHV